jgi:hypothetical protein
MPRPANAGSSSTASPAHGARVAWNERAYYAVKYLLIGGIVAAFVATALA